jgi:hypothetical protein
MTRIMVNELQNTVWRIIELLVTGRYDDVCTMTKGIRLSAQEMRTAIQDYGRTLVIPPEDWFQTMNTVAVRDSSPTRWSVTVPLWTKEEGRSDLSLELTLIQRTNGLEVELDDIHVL